jgi:hypothetical protein
MMVAVDVRWRPAEQRHKPRELALKLLLNLVQLQLAGLGAAPQPFAQLAMFIDQRRHGAQRPAMRQNEMQPDRQSRILPAERGRVLGAAAVHHRRGGGNDTMLIRLDDAVVLSFAQAEVVGIHDQ